MSKFEEFETWVEKYPWIKGGNSFQKTSNSYGIEHKLEYSSSWMEGVYEMWKKEIDGLNTHYEELIGRMNKDIDQNALQLRLNKAYNKGLKDALKIEKETPEFKTQILGKWNE